MAFRLYLTLSILCSTIFHSTLFSQSANNISISGKVIDGSNKEALAFATVLLIESKGQNQLAATISDEQGRFVLSTTYTGDALIQVSLTGYKLQETKVLIGQLNSTLAVGKIELRAIENQLQDVTVTAKANNVAAGLEKRSFDVSKVITQTGGTMLDVMRTLPGISIDQEGEVSLRGSDKVLVLIDGKQSGITGFGKQKGLENIPASSIERIEIINNPSSKYDAAGMAGIINIILKKEQKKGFNGNIGFATGLGEWTNVRKNLPGISRKYSFTPKINPSVGINYRNNNVNLFLQTDGIVRRKLNSNEFSNRVYKNGTPSILSQFLENRSQQEYNIKAGMDWQIGRHDDLTVYGLFQDEYHIDRGDVPYDDAKTGKRVRMWQWAEDERTYFMNYAANYRHKFAQPGHEISLGWMYTKGKEDEVFPFSDSSAIRQSNDKTHLITQEAVNSITLDYKLPLKMGKLEAGTKAQLRSIPIDYLIFPGSNSPLDPQLGKYSNYKEDIWGAYLNIIREQQLLDIEAGLRLEQTNVSYQIDPANKYYTNQRYNYLSLFPNIRLTRKINAADRISLFFNRRVDRPGEFDLRPFPKYDDPEILKVGNPQIRPQFTQTIELAYKHGWTSGSFYVSVFNRFIKNLFYRIYAEDSSSGSRLLYAIPDNLNNGNNLGFEISGEQRVSNGWNINGSLSWYNNTIQAAKGNFQYPYVQAYSLNRSNTNTWNLKLNNNLKMPWKLTGQLSFIYFAPDIIPQGKIKSRYSIDMGLKRTVLQNKAEVSLAITDLLHTNGIRRVINNQQFQLTANNYYETQVATVAFKYRF